MRAVRVIGLLLLAAFGWMPSTAALACVRGLDHIEQERAYYNAVTSVYVAVAQDFKPEDARYPSDNFTVQLRPVEPVWGEAPPPSPVRLEFTAGGCDDWYLWDDDDSEPLDGKRYFVFVAPPAKDDLTQLHVMPAGDLAASDAMAMLQQLKATGGAPPRPTDDLDKRQPAEPSPVSSAFWTRSYPWPWAAGAGGLLFILGLIIGRAIRPSSDKQRKNP